MSYGHNPGGGKPIWIQQQEMASARANEIRPITTRNIQENSP